MSVTILFPLDLEQAIMKFSFTVNDDRIRGGLLLLGVYLMVAAFVEGLFGDPAAGEEVMNRLFAVGTGVVGFAVMMLSSIHKWMKSDEPKKMRTVQITTKTLIIATIVAVTIAIALWFFYFYDG